MLPKLVDLVIIYFGNGTFFLTSSIGGGLKIISGYELLIVLISLMCLSKFIFYKLMNKKFAYGSPNRNFTSTIKTQ